MKPTIIFFKKFSQVPLGVPTGPLHLADFEAGRINPLYVHYRSCTGWFTKFSADECVIGFLGEDWDEDIVAQALNRRSRPRTQP